MVNEDGVCRELVELVREVYVGALADLSWQGGTIHLYVAGSACIGDVDDFVIHKV